MSTDKPLLLELWLEQNGYPYLEQVFAEFVDGPIARSRLNHLLAPLLAKYVSEREAVWKEVVWAGQAMRTVKYGTSKVDGDGKQCGCKGSPFLLVRCTECGKEEWI
jgi:hypothetical protein